MHLAVMFENIGGYHAARLRAAHAECADRGWQLTAIEISSARTEHPWGDLQAPVPCPVETVLPLDPGAALTAAHRRSACNPLRMLLDRLSPDAVAIPGWGFAYSRAALAWCRNHEAAAILMSESKQDDARRSRWREVLKSIGGVRRFDAALVGAASHARYLQNLGFRPHRIFFGYDVVDNAHFAQASAAARNDPEAARRREPLLPPGPYFLAVTRFIPRKNLSRLIQAFAHYRSRSVSPWHLVLCGGGEEEPALRSQIATLRLDRLVHLPGFVTYARIGDCYGLAGAFIHPALQEQWGLVVNEAMAAALPVLVSNRCGCYPDLVNDAGIGFDPESVDEMSFAMSRISESPSLQDALSASGLIRVARFAPDTFGRGLLSAVDAALHR